MPACAVRWCRSHTDMKHSGLTFHSFPKNKDMYKEWVRAVRLERHDPKWTPSSCSKICSIHFASDDIYNNGKVKRLVKSAVPICTMVGPINMNIEPYFIMQEMDEEDEEYEMFNSIEDSNEEPYFIKQEMNNDEQLEYSLPLLKECLGMVDRVDPNLETYFFKREPVEEQEDYTLFEVKREPKFGCVSRNKRNLKSHNRIVEDKCQMDDYTLFEVKREPKFDFVGGNKRKRKSYNSVIEDKSVMIECPNCQYQINVTSNCFDNSSMSPASESSMYNTKRKLDNQLKTDLAKKCLTKIKSLQRRNNRLKEKNLILKEVIANLRRNRTSESVSHNAFESMFEST